MESQMEIELTAPVTLSQMRGGRPQLPMNPAAHGWSRRPVVDTALYSGPGAWGRNKRWEYWGLMTPTHIIGFTVSSLDYAGVCQLYVVDRRTLTPITTELVSPFARGVQLPATYAKGPVLFESSKLNMRIDESREDVDGVLSRVTRLRAKSNRVGLDVSMTRIQEHEAMHVVVPWSKNRFQYTIKELALPAVGTLHIDGKPFPLGGPGHDTTWAVLDHGRGRWPYSMVWNWAAGSGDVNGSRIGLQLGSKWTHGTGSTENAIVVNGKTTKISEDLTWDYDTSDWLAPWRVHGAAMDVTFTPFYNRVSVTSMVVLAGTTNQGFGTWSGWVLGSDGTKISVDGLQGWAEEARNRW